MKKKLISSKDLLKIKKLKRPFVFVPMAADIIHHGHIRILKKAKTYGNTIVGLMTDRGIKSYKKSPILNFRQRKEIIESIKYVDCIISLDGLVYGEIAEKLKINYFLHGSDWKKGPQSIARKKLLELSKRIGMKVIDVPYTKNISSTVIKKKL
tara:strand:- start:37 stop:495 length:459 start_codon:yes stop_codon:yes gene_type:complete